ncbi:uncharacterized protein LOC112490697 isoform X4 [Ziziphus jujuba]|uniref:Uncharacterized protein LOC112490697 isoform X4 n=1 Tax=Ziziphus jujuba TaxID=326968 RepID=A0ABM3IGF2_ZIZJJ|nr:uncharacterized protein LOC112490697 isoform X4 [Ziziphus jujuba]
MRGINLTHLETGSLLSHRALFEASLAAPFEASSISHHHPLRSIVDLASPSPSKHLAGGRSLILEANYPSKHFWPVSLSSAASFLCFIDLPSSPELNYTPILIKRKQQYSSKDYAEVGVLTILSSSIAETSRRGWRVDNFKQQYSRNITQRLAC